MDYNLFSPPHIMLWEMFVPRPSSLSSSLLLLSSRSRRRWIVYQNWVVDQAEQCRRCFFSLLINSVICLFSFLSNNWSKSLILFLKMGRRYFCDSCQKRLPPGLTHRKMHQRSVQHLHNQHNYYRHYQSEFTQNERREEKRMSSRCLGDSGRWSEETSVLPVDCTRGMSIRQRMSILSSLDGRTAWTDRGEEQSPVEHFQCFSLDRDEVSSSSCSTCFSLFVDRLVPFHSPAKKSFQLTNRFSSFTRWIDTSGGEGGRGRMAQLHFNVEGNRWKETLEKREIESWRTDRLTELVDFEG